MSTQISQSYTFLPTQISGCQLWLDATDANTITLTGSNVTQWNDKSSNSFNAIKFSTTTGPTLSTRNNNVILNFKASSQQCLQVPFTSIYSTSTGLSIFVIFIYANPQTYNGARIYEWRSLERFIIPQNNTNPDNIIYNRKYTDNSISVTTGQFNLNTFYFSSYVETGNNSAFFLNGNQIGSSVRGPASNYLPFYLGYSGNSTIGAYDFLDGQIGEVIIYNTSLSTAQQQQIEGYLAWKWGLQGNLPGNHPYRTFPPFMNSLPLPYTPTLKISTQNNAVFVPTQISGCIMWIDAADRNTMTFSGSNVQSIQDKATSSRSFTATQGNFTYITDQGRQVLNLLNNTYMTTTTALSVTSGISWVFVATKLGTTNDAYLINFTPDGDEAFRYGYSGRYVGAPGAPGDLNDLLTPGQSYINGQFNTATTYTNYHQINGPIQTTRTTTSITISSPFASRYFIGTLCEIIVYTGPITTAQRQQVEGYLAWKWNLQGNLPATHPYKNSPYPGVPAAPVPAAPPQIKSGSWQPTQISGCRIWLDAADTSSIRFSGSSVTSITEKAQNIIFTTQGTSSFLTVKKQINGVQTLYFNNSAANNVYLQGTLANLLTGSVFFVWQAATQLSAGYRAFYSWQSAGGLTFPVFGYPGSATQVGPYTTFVGPGTPLTSVSAGTNYLTFYSWTGTTTNVGFNGATPTAGTQSAYSSSSSVFTIMGELDGGTTDTVNGYLGEIIFYNSVLSTAQRQQVEGYLAWKWGLQTSLPATHPYRYIPPSP